MFRVSAISLSQSDAGFLSAFDSAACEIPASRAMLDSEAGGRSFRSAAITSSGRIGEKVGLGFGFTVTFLRVVLTRRALHNIAISKVLSNSQVAT